MIKFKKLNHVEATEYGILWKSVVDLMEAHNVKGADFQEHLAFISDMVSLVVGICPHCYANGKDCQCWNDE